MAIHIGRRRLTGTDLTLLATEPVKYSALMAGVYFVAQDELNAIGVGIAGGVYFMATATKMIIQGAYARRDEDFLVNTLEERLSKK